MVSIYKLSALATITAAGTLAACGSSSTLSRSQLVSKANAICASAQHAASAVSAPANLLDVNAAAAYFDKIAPITAKETSQLEALSPDSSVAGDWNAFIAAQKAANSLLQTIKQKADAKDASGLQNLRQVPAAGNRVIATAKKLGAATCAQ